jgi:hypothetical protein
VLLVCTNVALVKFLAINVLPEHSQAKKINRSAKFVEMELTLMGTQEARSALVAPQENSAK